MSSSTSSSTDNGASFELISCGSETGVGTSAGGGIGGSGGGVGDGGEEDEEAEGADDAAARRRGVDSGSDAVVEELNRKLVWVQGARGWLCPL